MKYLIVKNFSKYQHYSNRSMIWIKMYVDTLQDYKYCQLNNIERLLWFGVLLLQARHTSGVPHDHVYLRRQILNNNTPDTLVKKALKTLIKNGMLASKTLARCYQVASLEEKRLEKNRKDYIYNKRELINKLSTKGK